MDFEWDERKREINRNKHGIAFEKVVEAFTDPFNLISLDSAHSTDNEKRQILIGRSECGIVVVVFTIRNSAIRLISARRANRRERKNYEAHKDR